ncbi:MAG: hypothetical protein QGG53_12675 [Planctomycetota bacterium]|jgi:hypothetical protein|nr:hypothetical protein [Planctomycetota bacterium]
MPPKNSLDTATYPAPERRLIDFAGLPEAHFRSAALPQATKKGMLEQHAFFFEYLIELTFGLSSSKVGLCVCPVLVCGHDWLSCFAK